MFQTITNIIEKARESETIAYPTLVGSRIAHRSRINNADAHASNILNRYIRNNERHTLFYRARDWNLRDSQGSQIKRQFNVFLLCLPLPFMETALQN